MGTLTPTNPSLWVATTDRTNYPALDHNLAVDVAVIGAGITGLTTALSLQQDGASVAVLEADEVCSGVTGYTTAKVTSLHGLVYAALASTYGDDVARTYGAANEAGLAMVTELVSRLGIDCDFSRRPAYTYTESADEVEAIAAEVEVAQRVGLPASFTTETELPFEVKGAVRFDDQAQFHPRRYCLALAEAFTGAGGRLFERTRVVGVDEGSPCTVKAESSAVEAGHVVLATHLPILDRGGFFAKCHPSRSYCIAARVELPVLSGMYLSADTPTRSMRTAEDDSVVVFGGEGHKTGQEDDTRARYAALESWARRHFAVVSVDHRWSAQDYMPADGLPFIGRQASGSSVLVATGFKKWGMSNGTVAARILSDIVAGRQNEWAATFDATRAKSSLTSLDFFKENLDVGRQFIGDRVASLRAPDADSLAPGEAGIVQIGGEKVAAFRDDQGALHVVSAACRHLGCLVSFNTAERTWDCPCHGSRYDVDGRVIDGPSVRDLEQQVVEAP